MKTALLALCFSTITAAADVTISFRYGAPVDTFKFTPTQGCLTGMTSVTIDLVGSQGELIFDITDAGAGGEVFQPFVAITGQDMLVSASAVADGDKTLTADAV